MAEGQRSQQQLFYALTNTVKDHLADKVTKAPFFSTFDHLATGKPLKFWYIDWDAYWQAGGPLKKKHRPKDYLTWVEFEMAPLPAWQNLTESQRQTRVRKTVREPEFPTGTSLDDEAVKRAVDGHIAELTSE